MQKLEIEEIEPFQVDYPSPTTIVVKKERPGFGISGLALIALGVVMLCFVVVFARYEKNEIDTNNITGMDGHSEQIVIPKDEYNNMSSTGSTFAPTSPPTSNPTTMPKSSRNKVVVTKKDGKMYNIIGGMLYHNKAHFTQGLTYSKSSNMLFASNGLYRQSNLCRLDPETGHEVLCKDDEPDVFAEGMQVYDHGYDEKLIQLTWQSQRGFIYNATSLERISVFTFTTRTNEGWGICLDQQKNEFIVSDGSNTLHFWDVHTLEEKRRVPVFRQNGDRASNLNELEFVKGKVVANVWYEDVVLVINPVTGECEGEYDFAELWPSHERARDRADVLNGISISKDDDILYITGKKWNRMFKVTLRDFPS